tara:strand:+ start:2440 stop:2763 length:324 start_codon:yes stop_codon:yes gene_type:complete
MADPVPDQDDLERFKSEIPEEFRDRPDAEDSDASARIGLSTYERLQWAILLGVVSCVLTMIILSANNAPLPAILFGGAIAGVAVGLLVLIPGVLLVFSALGAWIFGS